jgi:hypothetical protein
MKMTRTELKEMIREVLKEELSKKPLNEAAANYKYYYVVCVLEDFGKISEVLAAGVRKVDVDWCSKRGYDPAEEAMTDFWDATEIPYSDNWDDDMYDSLMRYVYEIDETTYNTRAGLPKADADIIKYVEDSTAEYED